MKKFIVKFFFVAISFATFCSAQTNEGVAPISDTAEEYHAKYMKEYLSPVRATFFSALLPGLGQFYNKQYWKVPIIYGVLATTLYFYTARKSNYNRFRKAYKKRLAGFHDDEFYDINKSGIVVGSPDVSTQTLVSAQETLSQDIDLTITLTVIAYALNIIDASVSAHLKNFNLDNDLSIKYYSKRRFLGMFNEVGLTMAYNF